MKDQITVILSCHYFSMWIVNPSFLSHFTVVVTFIAYLLVHFIIQTNVLEENLKRKPLYEITHINVNLPPISFPLVLPDILRVVPYFLIRIFLAFVFSVIKEL